MGTTEIRTRFHELHHGDELFVIPNPWDVGSAKLLVDLGFQALATTSSGYATSLGRTDGQVSADELVAHTAALSSAVDVPVSVDAERCFGETPAEVADYVAALADAGAAGCSIEDWDPDTDTIDPVDQSVERVAAAVEAANRAGMVLTARAENVLRGISDLDEAITRLIAYRDAGAHCLYAPGPTDLADITRIVREVAAPINVLTRPGAPPITELADIGVRRVSTGGSLAKAAYDAAATAAAELRIA